MRTARHWPYSLGVCLKRYLGRAVTRMDLLSCMFHHLHCVCNRFRRFTSGVTPAHLSALRSSCFRSSYFHTYEHWWGSSPDWAYCCLKTCDSSDTLPNKLCWLSFFFLFKISVSPDNGQPYIYTLAEVYVIYFPRDSPRLQHLCWAEGNIVASFMLKRR